MNNRHIIENAVSERDGILFLDGHEIFEYSDGGSVERRIERIVGLARDRSSDSRELEEHITDWPSLYHLSRTRALAYRSLDIPPSARVLEVGSGCGSITRYLGEQAAFVLALEGSPRRARITRARTREQENVAVLCASFEDVNFSTKFDLVVLNGVFEYSSLFVDHDEPHRHMLSMLSRLMAPDASLVIAIENQCGLRYFSSGTEEHSGLMFDGIEDYAGAPDGARTFGSARLKAMLSEVFESVETLLPIPDYKIPRGVVSSKLLDEVSCAELFASSMAFDNVCMVRPLIHERLTWQVLEDNGLLEPFSNSLFMVASNAGSPLVDPLWRGDLYSIQRSPEWSVQTRFSLEEDGSIWSRKSYLAPGATRDPECPFEHHLAASPWQPGESVHTAIVRALCRRGPQTLEERLSGPVLAWWSEIGRVETPRGWVDGASFDRHWQNSLVHDGEMRFIDEEWIWRTPLDPVWFLYRVVSKFVRDEMHFTHRWRVRGFGLSTYAILKAVGRAVHVDIDLRALTRAVRRESEFQNSVTGRKDSVVLPLARALVPLSVQHAATTVSKLSSRVVGRAMRTFRRDD